MYPSDAKKAPGRDEPPDPIGAVDELRERLRTAESEAREKALRVESVKAELTALEESVKQVDQAVKEYEDAYKALADDRPRLKRLSDEAKRLAKRHLNQQEERLLDERIRKEDEGYNKSAPDLIALRTEQWDARVVYEYAALALEKAQWEFDRLRGYLKQAQKGGQKLKDYADRADAEVKKQKVAAAYVLAHLVDFTYVDPNYLPGPYTPRGDDAQQQQQQKQQQAPATGGAGGDQPSLWLPARLRDELMKAWIALQKASTAYRDAKVAYDLSNALLKDGEKKLEEARKLREQDLLREAAEVDKLRAQPPAANKGAGAQQQPAGAAAP